MGAVAPFTGKRNARRRCALTCQRNPLLRAQLRFFYRAGNRVRTGDLHVGNVTLYQLSYSRDLYRGNSKVTELSYSRVTGKRSVTAGQRPR